jgi:hypothetical protein
MTRSVGPSGETILAVASSVFAIVVAAFIWARLFGLL